MPPSQSIKFRIRELRKASSIQFDEELFISILLCLVSAGDRHLILTCPEESIKGIKLMTEQICQSIFGLSTVSAHCDPVQAPQDFVPLLFTHGTNVHRQNSTATQKTFQKEYPGLGIMTPLTPNSLRRKSTKEGNSDRDQETLLSSSLTSTSASITEDDESSHRSISDSESLTGYTGYTASAHMDNSSNRVFPTMNNSSPTRSSNTPRSSRAIPILSAGPNPAPSSSNPATRPGSNFSLNSHFQNSSPIHYNPITPSDFTIPTKKRRESSATHLSMRPSSNEFGDGGGSPAERLTGNVGSVSPRRVAQAVVLERFETASGLVQAAVLELLIQKQVIDRGMLFNLPKPFIIIAILPYSRNRHNLLSQLIDHFYISYTFEGIIPPVPNNKPTQLGRKTALFKNSEVENLAARTEHIHVSSDILRYIRDIIVGIRMHPKVKGGLTAHASMDFTAVIKALAAVFQREYITPDLVLVASSRVFPHHLILVDDEKHGGVTVADVINDILEVVWPPI